MSIKKVLAVALADYLPVFVAIFGVTLFGVSTYFGNVTLFLLSIVIISVLPPILEAVGRSLKEKYGAMQNEMDIIAMIPEWLLGLEMLSSIVVIIVSAVLKNVAICYLALWFLTLGDSLTMAKEINGLKEDLRSPDLERRRAAIEKVELYKRIVYMTSVLLISVGFLIFALEVAIGSANSALVGVVVIASLAFVAPLPVLIVHEQADKVMPSEPEKAARAAS